MEYIDAKAMDTRTLNKAIALSLKASGRAVVTNPHSMHNIAAGLTDAGQIIVQGSTGFYTGGFLEGPTIIVEGNAGWYAGDNMMDGQLIISKNAGCNAGTYLCGGTILIRGNAGSRTGYAMKGGTILVCGSVGRWSGQMTMGGQLVVLGEVGKQIGESMYKGVIYVRDQQAAEKLGGNVYLDSITVEEVNQLQQLFDKYQLDATPKEFKAIRPCREERHSYSLFNPELKPHLARKFNVRGDA